MPYDDCDGRLGWVDRTPNSPCTPAAQAIGGLCKDLVPALEGLGLAADQALPVAEGLPQGALGHDGPGPRWPPAPSGPSGQASHVGKVKKAKGRYRKACSTNTSAERRIAAAYEPSPSLPDAAFKFGRFAGYNVSELATYNKRVWYLRWCQQELSEDHWTGKQVLEAVKAHLEDFDCYMARHSTKK